MRRRCRPCAWSGHFEKVVVRTRVARVLEQHAAGRKVGRVQRRKNRRFERDDLAAEGRAAHVPAVSPIGASRAVIAQAVVARVFAAALLQHLRSDAPRLVHWQRVEVVAAADAAVPADVEVEGLPLRAEPAVAPRAGRLAQRREVPAPHDAVLVRRLEAELIARKAERVELRVRRRSAAQQQRERERGRGRAR